VEIAICAFNAEQRKLPKWMAYCSEASTTMPALQVMLTGSYRSVKYEEDSVIVRNLPFNTRKNAEALRMSVGLTLREDKVTVIFIDEGVYTATPTKPEIINIPPPVREFGALTMLKCRMLADKPSLEKRE